MTEEKYCDKCGALQQDRAYTSDSFETCFKWHCKMLKKDIQDEVDWNDHNIKALNDCPLRPNKTPREKLKDNYKIKNIKLMKENKGLRKEITQLNNKLKRINDLCSKSK